MVELVEDARMGRPQRHRRIGAEWREVLGAEFDGLGLLRGFAHGVLLMFIVRQVRHNIVQCDILTDTDQSIDHL